MIGDKFVRKECVLRDSKCRDFPARILDLDIVRKDTVVNRVM